MAYCNGTIDCTGTPDGYADASGYARPYTGTEVFPAFGVTTRPVAHTVSDLCSQPFWPRYQIAIQSPCTSATAYRFPVSTRLPMSLIPMVSGVPSGRSAMSFLIVTSLAAEVPVALNGLPSSAK